MGRALILLVVVAAVAVLLLLSASPPPRTSVPPIRLDPAAPRTSPAGLGGRESAPAPARGSRDVP